MADLLIIQTNLAICRLASQFAHCTALFANYIRDLSNLHIMPANSFRDNKINISTIDRQQSEILTKVIPVKNVHRRSTKLVTVNVSCMSPLKSNIDIEYEVLW